LASSTPVRPYRTQPWIERSTDPVSPLRLGVRVQARSRSRPPPRARRRPTTKSRSACSRPRPPRPTPPTPATTAPPGSTRSRHLGLRLFTAPRRLAPTSSCSGPATRASAESCAASAAAAGWTSDSCLTSSAGGAGEPAASSELAGYASLGLFRAVGPPPRLGVVRIAGVRVWLAHTTRVRSPPGLAGRWAAGMQGAACRHRPPSGASCPPLRTPLVPLFIFSLSAAWFVVTFRLCACLEPGQFCEYVIGQPRD